MKKVNFMLIFMFFISVIVFSQDYKGRGRIMGYVYDEDNNPLKGVKVKLFHLKSQSGFEVVTDSKGQWKGSWIVGGRWNIDFEKLGYLPKKISYNVKEYERNPQIEIKMEKAEGIVISEDFKSNIMRGDKLFEEEKFSEAIGVYKKILEQFPDAVYINRNIGNAYFQMEKYDQAVEYYQEILEKEPDNNEVKILIGNSYANQGNNEKAQEWYNKIELENIKDTTVLYNIGTNYYNISRFEEALKYYNKAVEIQGDFLDAIYQLGLTHLTLGNYKEAIEVFENYIHKDPNSKRALQAKDFIEFLKKKI
jgi:tetratricopeptide (TPR) repeat protein